MSLPIVPGSEVITPAGTVPLDPSAFRQAALAPGRLAEAIGQNVGGLFEDLSQKIQATRNAKKVFDADHAMRSAKEQFLADLSKNPELAGDPGKWIPAWQERAKQTTDGILSQSGLGPAVKRHLTQMAGMWELDSTSEIRTQALRREQADFRKSGLMTYNDALNAGQPDQAAAAVKALNEHGAMGPRETAARIKQIPALLAERQANGMIAADPINAPKMIEEKLAKDLPPQKLRPLLHVAQEMQSRARTANAQELSERIDDSPDHTIDGKLLTSWRDSGKIDAYQYERMQARMKAYGQAATREANKKETDELHLALMEADNPPTDDKAMDSWAKQIKDEGLGWTNPEHRRKLNEYVDRKVKNVKNQGTKGENAIETHVLSDMYHDRLLDENDVIDRLTKKDNTGSFSVGDDEVTKAYGKSRKEVVNAAKAQRAQLMQRMRDFFRSNPEATEPEADEFRAKLMEPIARAAVASAVAPKKDTTKDDYEKLPKGAKYFFWGREYTKE